MSQTTDQSALQEVVLEPSTNTHTVKAPFVSKEEPEVGVVLLKIQGEGKVEHGDHGTFTIDSSDAIKYNQVEFDPIQKALRAAFD